ncbi:hypothetical protein HY489_00525 [Candidatus Woesearchaeota archaeon]|nr:hypothetical protein [Candidatus Woesearchaeota archaeon]
MKTARKRLKPLLPSLKEKKRYLAFEIVSESKIKEFSEVSRAIWNSSLSFYGTKGVATMGIQLLPEKYQATRQRGLIRVSHKSLDAMRACLALVTQVENQPAIIRSIGASGIIAKAEKKYLEV